jgi:hypothetical protein
MNLEPQNIECRMSNGNIGMGHFNILHSIFDILRFKRTVTEFIKFETYRVSLCNRQFAASAPGFPLQAIRRRCQRENRQINREHDARSPFPKRKTEVYRNSLVAPLDTNPVKLWEHI